MLRRFTARAAIEMAGVATAQSDPGTLRFLRVNRKLCGMLGYSRKELLRMTAEDVSHPDDWHRDLPRLEALLRGELDELDTTKRYLRKDGEIIFGHTVVTVLRDKRGRPLSTVAASLDVTRQVRAEQALRESEARYRTLFEHCPVGLGITGMDGAVIDVNDAALALVGYSRAELMGARDVRQFYATPAARDELLARLRTHGRVESAPVHARRRDGSIYEAEVSLVPIRLDGQPCLLSMQRDVTERRQAERALEALAANLEREVAERTAEAEARADRMRRMAVRIATAEEQERQRIARLLHDHLQQHLAAAALHASVAARACGDERPRASLAVVQGTLDEVMATLRTLTAELSPPMLRHGGLAAALRWLVDEMGARHGLQVELAVAGGVDPVARDVRDALFQAARELLFNVVKHAGTDAARLSVRPAGTELVVLEVADHGKGLPEAAPDSTEGFGLFSLRERMDLLGGRFELHGGPGSGTRVVVVVPREPPADARAEVRQPS